MKNQKSPSIRIYPSLASHPTAIKMVSPAQSPIQVIIKLLKLLFPCQDFSKRENYETDDEAPIGQHKNPT